VIYFRLSRAEGIGIVAALSDERSRRSRTHVRSTYQDAYLSPFFAEAKIVSRDPDTNGVDDLEQFAIWIYSSTNARWYEIVNGELWTGHPRPDIQLFSEILNCALEKLHHMKASLSRLPRW